MCHEPIDEVVIKVSFQIMIQLEISISYKAKYTCSGVSDKISPVKYSVKFIIQKPQDNLMITKISTI
jgi:hypothetical protein